MCCMFCPLIMNKRTSSIFETKNPEVENTVPVKPCRYGAECHGLKNGRCPFNHPEPVAKTTKPCKYGFECYGFKNGRCPFIHN